MCPALVTCCQLQARPQGGLPASAGVPLESEPLTRAVWFLPGCPWSNLWSPRVGHIALIFMTAFNLHICGLVAVVHTDSQFSQS